MNADRFFNLLGSIVTVALVSSILIRGDKFAAILRAGGQAFAQAIKAAANPRG